MIFMKVIKKNQVIVFTFALLLMVAGYINYSKNNKVGLETAGLVDSEEVAGIGDAQLVNSNNVVEEETTNNSNQNSENSNNTVQANSTVSDYFTNSRIEREKMYSQMLETYQKILDSTSISEEQKSVSQQEITKIHNIKNGIMIAENLIKNKGFSDVIIFVNDFSISVIVNSKTLQEAETAQIQNIVMRELNAKVEDIHISNKEL